MSTMGRKPTKAFSKTNINKKRKRGSPWWTPWDEPLVFSSTPLSHFNLQHWCQWTCFLVVSNSICSQRFLWEIANHHIKDKCLPNLKLWVLCKGYWRKRQASQELSRTVRWIGWIRIIFLSVIFAGVPLEINGYREVFVINKDWSGGDGL